MLRLAFRLDPGPGSCAATRSTGTSGWWRLPSTRTWRPWVAAIAPASRTRLPDRSGTVTTRDERTARIVTRALRLTVASNATANNPYFTAAKPRRRMPKDTVPRA